MAKFNGTVATAERECVSCSCKATRAVRACAVISTGHQKRKRKKQNGNVKKEENNQSYFCTADVCVVMHIDI
jgi:hypothetical protein